MASDQEELELPTTLEDALALLLDLQDRVLTLEKEADNAN